MPVKLGITYCCRCVRRNDLIQSFSKAADLYGSFPAMQRHTSDFRSDLQNRKYVCWTGLHPIAGIGEPVRCIRDLRAAQGCEVLRRTAKLQRARRRLQNQKWKRSSMETKTSVCHPPFLFIGPLPSNRTQSKGTLASCSSASSPSTRFASSFCKLQ